MTIALSCLSALAALSFLLGLLVLSTRRTTPLPVDTKTILIALMVIYLVVSLSNFLEFAGITNSPSLDRIEDYLQLFFPVLWIFMILTSIRESQQRKLQLMHEEWKRTFDFMPSLVSIFDIGGRVDKANLATIQKLEETGIPQERMFSTDIVGGEKGLRNLVDKPAVEIESHDFGGAFLVMVEKIPSDTDDMHLHIAQDVTKLKDLRSRVAEMKKMDAIGGLAGGLAHDFKNVLSGILGYSSLLLEDTRLSVGQQKALEAIKASSERGEEIVRELLSFSTTRTPERELVDLNKVVLDVLTILAETFPPGIEVVPELASDLPAISADQLSLFQLTMNLATNARDAIPAEGTMVLRTFIVQKENRIFVSMEVEDNGVGMSTEIVERMYEPFFTTKPKGKGTGLGLATVYATVRSHGGTIECSSKPGLGTNFTVIFPPAEIETKLPLPGDY